MGNSGSSVDPEEQERNRQITEMQQQQQVVPRPQVPLQMAYVEPPRPQPQVQRMYPELEIPRQSPPYVDIRMEHIPQACPGHRKEMQPARVNIKGFETCVYFGVMCDERYPNSCVVAALQTTTVRDSTQDNRLTFVNDTAYIVDISRVTLLRSVVSAILRYPDGLCIEMLFMRMNPVEMRKKPIQLQRFIERSFGEPDDETRDMIHARDLFIGDHPEMFAGH